MFEAEIIEMRTIPISVIIKILLTELWDEDGFSIVGSAIGYPLFASRLTEEGKRTSYARIYVEIATECEYPEVTHVVLDERRAYLLPV